MKAMLDRLKGADLNTFAAYVKLMRDCNMFIDARISPAILQAVLQEAITSRGWLLEQSTYTVKPSAKIWKTADPIWKTYRGVGDSPVAALLAAYLSAIEEQA